MALNTYIYIYEYIHIVEKHWNFGVEKAKQMALLFRFHYGQHLFMAIHLEILLEIYTSQFPWFLQQNFRILLCPRALFLLGGHVCELPLSVRIIPFIWVDFEVEFRFVHHDSMSIKLSHLWFGNETWWNLSPRPWYRATQLSWSIWYMFFLSYEVMKSAVVTSPMNPISNHISSWAAMWEERELGPVVPRNGTNNTTMETTRGCNSVTNVRHCHSCWKCTFHHIIYIYIYVYIYIFWRYMYDFANDKSLLADYLTSVFFNSILPSVWNEGAVFRRY